METEQPPALAGSTQLADSDPQGEMSFFLAFRDAALETTYLQAMDRERRRSVNSGLMLAIFLLFALSLFDTTFVPRHSLEKFEQIRFYIWVPSLVVGLLGNLRIKDAVRSIWWLTAMSVVTVLSLAALTRLAGTTSLEYLQIFTFQILLFIYFMVGLPFRYASVVALSICVVQIATLLSLDLENSKLAMALTMLMANNGLMTFPAYRSELASRQSFLAKDQLTREYGQRLTAERDRGQWLANFAQVLRHELKNAIASMGQSLKLTEQTPLEASKYLPRAQRSLDFMRRFLQKAGEATSLEAALSLHEFELVDLSALVAERVQDYQHELPGHTLEFQAAPGIKIQGNPDRLIQMLDKLVNNAAEHRGQDAQVMLRLEADGGKAILTVANFGDALPDDLDRIFQPFFSNKSGHGHDNLGLGLYVAQTIAHYHGGAVNARRLQNPNGAEFTVRLPLSI